MWTLPGGIRILRNPCETMTTDLSTCDCHCSKPYRPWHHVEWQDSCWYSASSTSCIFSRCFRNPRLRTCKHKSSQKLNHPESWFDMGPTDWLKPSQWVEKTTCTADVERGSSFFQWQFAIVHRLPGIESEDESWPTAHSMRSRHHGQPWRKHLVLAAWPRDAPAAFQCCMEECLEDLKEDLPIWMTR